MNSNFQFLCIVIPSLNEKEETDYLKPVVINFLHITFNEQSLFFPISKVVVDKFPYQFNEFHIVRIREVLNDLKSQNQDYSDFIENLESTIEFLNTLGDDISEVDNFFELISKLFINKWNNKKHFKFFYRIYKNKVNLILNNPVLNVIPIIKDLSLMKPLEFLYLFNFFLYQCPPLYSSSNELNNLIKLNFDNFVCNRNENKKHILNDLFITHYSNLSHGVYSNIISNKDLYQSLTNEIKKHDFSGLTLLNSMILLDVNEVHVLNKNSKNIGIVFESKHFSNLCNYDYRDYIPEDVRQSSINNIIFRGTKSAFPLNYAFYYIKSFIFDFFLPKFSYGKKFFKQYIPFINKENTTIFSGHSYGARNAYVAFNEFENKKFNVKGFLLSLPGVNFLSKKFYSVENHDGKIYSKHNDIIFSSHKDDPITITTPLLAFFISALFSGFLYYLKFDFLFSIFSISTIFSLIKVVSNFKNHRSVWLKDHTSFFINFKDTLFGKYSYNNNLTDEVLLIQKIFDTLNGKFPTFNFIFTHIDKSLPQVYQNIVDNEDSINFQNAINNLKSKNIDFISLFNSCLLKNKGTNFDNFFTPEICEVLKFLEYPNELKKNLESFFTKINKIKFNYH